MIKYLTAKQENKDELMTIWKDTFTEEGMFLSWFFKNRFIPEFCTVAEVDGNIASCVHALPANIRVRDAILRCAIIAGVATLPEYRGMGLMHGVMTEFMNKMNAMSVSLVAHRPVKLSTFFSLGHYPVSDSKYFISEKDEKRDICSMKSSVIDIGENISALYLCYMTWSRTYSGIIERSYADFSFKFGEYIACGTKCVAHFSSEGTIDGYCVLYEDEDSVYADECIGSESALFELSEDMGYYAKGKKITIRLPSYINVSTRFGKSETLQKSVIGVADIKMLLKSIGLKGVTMRITDSVVPFNDGVFDSGGSRSDKEPQIEISAGHLAQWAFGYRSISEIPEASIYDKKAVEMLDSVPKCKCFIVDEY